jgi:hypothetical protein
MAPFIEPGQYREMIRRAPVMPKRDMDLRLGEVVGSIIAACALVVVAFLLMAMMAG